VKKLVNGVSIGETLLLPLIVERSELLLLLVRRSDRFYDLIVVATDPEMGLRHHPVNAALGAKNSKTSNNGRGGGDDGGDDNDSAGIHFRTCLAINEIEKKLAIDDVFWSAVYNLTVRAIIHRLLSSPIFFKFQLADSLTDSLMHSCPPGSCVGGRCVR
jgi:hypothetical protein